MSQPKGPVPLPRKMVRAVRSVDEELLKCNSTPRSPTKGSEREPAPPLHRKWATQDYETGNNYVEIITPMNPVSPSGKVDQIIKAFDAKQLKYNPSPRSPTSEKEPTPAPPPLSPRKWVLQEAEQNETGHEYEEVLQDDKPFKAAVEPQPPRLPARQHKHKLVRVSETLDDMSLSDSYEVMTPWSDVCRDLKLRGSSETEVINVKAELLYKAIQLYNQLMTEHSGNLKELINELHSIATNLDKFSKGTKIAGITGGASTVAGGVAAAAGVILSPFTAGASLALTAVGVGVAAAGGVTGASAAIANKANLSKEKSKIDKTLQDFDVCHEKILSCLKFVNEGMESLKLHGVSVLHNTERYSSRVANIVQLVTGDATAMTSEMSSKSSGLIKGFALGMDFFFTEGKDGPKVKKGLESKLAKKLRKLAEDLDKGLNELMHIKDVFSRLD
ncbi:uncharacterized protein LOC108235742 [Kryptolebias marmoratus]|uniref:uncharacterized protein LOC108235742 n=1 Tax=Kryptolebias marmoratus TaxID=37003 RepID=UPI0007F917A3|nr:uncharacterized protein LOC108235742 [Kryptolebias marmoratus]